MDYNIYINGNQFDNLDEKDKMHFKYCPICCVFYNTNYLSECRKHTYHDEVDEYEEINKRKMEQGQHN